MVSYFVDRDQRFLVFELVTKLERIIHFFDKYMVEVFISW